MARSKNKWDIISNDLIKLDGRWINTNSYIWFDYDDYDYDYDYDYRKNIYYGVSVYSDLLVKKVKVKSLVGINISLESMYSKEILRDRKIKEILGESESVKLPTLGDILKK
jgi:hypothetical protein